MGNPVLLICWYVRWDLTWISPAWGFQFMHPIISVFLSWTDSASHADMKSSYVHFLNWSLILPVMRTVYIWNTWLCNKMNPVLIPGWIYTSVVLKIQPWSLSLLFSFLFFNKLLKVFFFLTLKFEKIWCKVCVQAQTKNSNCWFAN